MTDIEEIYKLYFNDVYKYLLSLSYDKMLAEDISQETFYKAMKNISTFKGDCSIRVWLCQIAKNTFYSHKRKEKGRSVNIDDFEFPDVSNLERLVIHKEEAKQILNILEKMDDPYREVFNMRYFADMSFAAIGEIKSKSESWARVTYHRARKKIMEEINE